MPIPVQASQLVVHDDRHAFLDLLLAMLRQEGYHPTATPARPHHSPSTPVAALLPEELRFVSPSRDDCWRTMARLDRELARYPFVLTTTDDPIATTDQGEPAAEHAICLVLVPCTTNPLRARHPAYRVEERLPDQAAFIVGFQDSLALAEGMLERRRAHLLRDEVSGHLRIIDQATERVIAQQSV